MANVRNDDAESLDFADESEYIGESGRVSSALYAEVTLTNGRVTDDSTVTVEGKTVNLMTRTANAGRAAPARIGQTLASIGYRTLEILPSGSDSVRVLVERDSA
jgi:hypothetical protein